MLTEQELEFAKKWDLTLNQVMLFSIIHAYTDSDGICRMNNTELSQRSMLTRPTVISVVNTLLDRNFLITKEGGLKPKIGLIEGKQAKVPKTSRDYSTTQFKDRNAQEHERQTHKYRDKDYVGIVEMNHDTHDEIERVTEEVPKQVKQTTTQDNHENSFQHSNVSAYDRCYGASQDVYRQWESAKHAGSKLTLQAFTEQWVMKGEEKPNINQPLQWGAYQREMQYRVSLLYKEK